MLTLIRNCIEWLCVECKPTVWPIWHVVNDNLPQFTSNRLFDVWMEIYLKEYSATNLCKLYDALLWFDWWRLKGRFWRALANMNMRHETWLLTYRACSRNSLSSINGNCVCCHHQGTEWSMVIGHTVHLLSFIWFYYFLSDFMAWPTHDSPLKLRPDRHNE